MEPVNGLLKDWPVILQGTIGAALFWVFLAIGQKLLAYCSQKVSHFSKTARKSWLVSMATKYLAGIADDHSEVSRHVSTLVYRSSRHLYRGATWLAVGLIVNSLFSPLGVIGFVGALVYWMKALEIVKGIPDDVDREAKLKEIVQEYKALKGEQQP